MTKDIPIPALVETPATARTTSREGEPTRMSRRNGVMQVAKEGMPKEFIDPETGEPFRRKSLSEQIGAWNELAPDSMRAGWAYQWCPVKVLNEPVDASQARVMHQGGWRPVHPSEMPKEVPPGYTGSTIERHGQILYKRPAYLNSEAKAEANRVANERVMDKFKQVESTPKGTLPRVVGEVKQTIEALPDDLRRERAMELGELEIEDV